MVCGLRWSVRERATPAYSQIMFAITPQEQRNLYTAWQSFPASHQAAQPPRREKSSTDIRLKFQLV